MYIQLFSYPSAFSRHTTLTPCIFCYRDDVICNYPTAAVVSACGEVFERLSADDHPDLHLSYAAYSQYAPHPICSNSKVSFTALRFNEPPDIPQDMMPCRGQHEPLRTSITTDDYYDDFYISTGTESQFIMVYKLEKGPNSEFFRPLEHYKSITTTAETIITNVPLEDYYKQILSPPVSRNDNAKEVEIVYVREVLASRKREKQTWEYVLIVFQSYTSFYSWKLNNTKLSNEQDLDIWCSATCISKVLYKGA